MYTIIYISYLHVVLLRPFPEILSEVCNSFLFVCWGLEDFILMPSKCTTSGLLIWVSALIMIQIMMFIIFLYIYMCVCMYCSILYPSMLSSMLSTCFRYDLGTSTLQGDDPHGACARSNLGLWAVHRTGFGLNQHPHDRGEASGQGDAQKISRDF